MTWHICCDEGEWEPIFWRSFGFGWFFCYDDYFKAFSRQVHIGIPTKNKVCLVKIDLHHSERKDTVTVYLPKALNGAFSSRKGSIKASAKWKICIQGSK